MLREIKYIWYGMTYSELREVLRDGRKLRGFPLVDNPGHMILLGSIQRQELIAAIEKQVRGEGLAWVEKIVVRAFLDFFVKKKTT